MTLVPFFVGGLLVGIVVFVPAWLLTPQGTTPQTFNFDLIVGAFVGLIAGLIGGTLVEFVSKFVFAPAYGRLLLKRPPTVLSLFNDSEDVISLSAKFADEKKKLRLTFENDEIAREFAALNPQEN